MMHQKGNTGINTNVPLLLKIYSILLKINFSPVSRLNDKPVYNEW